jgi:hypothetical protein
MVAVSTILLGIAVSPTFLVWGCARLWLPALYSFPPFWMTGLCAILSVATGMVLRLELEGGIFSAFIFIMAISLFWSLVLLVVGLIYKYFSAKRRQYGNS